MSIKTCVIVGVGPGIGKACCELYDARGYRVVMMARNKDYLDSLVSSLPGETLALEVDVTDQESVKRAFDDLHKQFGAVETLVYNAARGSFGNFLEVDPSQLEKNFAVNTMGLLYCARAAAPAMIERGNGSIIVTGNTAATRGGANFATFAPSKSAARSLSQSMARTLGPLKIHLAYIVIDAAVDGPFARKLRPEEKDEFFASPLAIAEAVWYLDNQPADSWTFEMDLRPHVENW